MNGPRVLRTVGKADFRAPTEFNEEGSRRGVPPPHGGLILGYARFGGVFNERFYSVKVTPAS